MFVVPVETNSFLKFWSWNILNSKFSSDEWPTPKTKLLFLIISILGLINENSCVPPVDESSIILIGSLTTSDKVSPSLKLSSSTLNTKYEFLSDKPSEGEDEE